MAAAPSSYAWTVPDKAGTNLRVRVRDANNTNVWYESGSAFRIKGKVQLDVPNLAGLSWTVGSTQTIQWSATGTFSPVELHYDRDGDFVTTTADTFAVTPLSTVTNCSPVSPAITCTGTASFNIEDKITAAAKVRVRGLGADSDVSWISANPFRIRGAIAVTGPATGAVWNVGETTKQILWTSTGTITNVKIEYKTSAAGAYTTIALNDPGHTAGANTYTWTAGVPDANTEDAYIRVCDAGAGFTDVCGESVSFKIRPQITVTNPVLNQQVVAGTNYPGLIKWTKTGTTISLVKVLYSTDGTTFPDPANLIADNVPVATGTAGLDWNIPAATVLTTAAKVRVIDKGNANVIGDSSPFKIKGGLTLTAPAGGVTWTAGSVTNNVTWTFSGTIANVTVKFDPNSGKGADNIAGTADDYPTLIGTKAQTGASGSSSLTWDMSATGTNTTTVTNTGKVKIYDAGDPLNVVAENTVDFKIGAKFDLLNPESGMVIYAADPATITWTPQAGTGVTDVKIEYTNNASAPIPTWVELDSAAVKPNTGSYAWASVPGTTADLNNDGRIRISQKSPLNTDVVDTGAGTPFRIKAGLQVTVPGTGSESWSVGSIQTIKIKKKGSVALVNLYYDYNLGKGADNIAGNADDYATLITAIPLDISGAPDVNGEYSYSWTIGDTTPLTAGFTGKIKVKAVTPATQTDVEAVQVNAIEVKGSVTLLTPTATGVVLNVGDPYTITWTKNGAVTNVNLHYSTNGGIVGGGTYPDTQLIATVAAAPPSYAWTVPDKVGTNLRVRVRDANNTNVWFESGSAFRVKGKVQLTAPEIAGLSYTVGTSQTITWTSTGTFSPVELHYDVDGNFATTADTFPVLPLSTVTNCSPVFPAITCSGSAGFTIENKIGGSNKVRIRGTGVDADVQWISTNPFKILGGLDVTAPEAGQIWSVGETNRTITWDANGTVTNVNIGYKTSAGASCNYTNVVANDGAHAAGANSFAWTAGVADEKSETMYICIQDANFPEVTNVGAAPFSIRPVLAVTSPTAGQRVVVGSNNAGLVKWTRTGTKTTQVDIKYDTNDGKGLDNIAGTADDYAGTIATLVDASTGAIGVAWNNVPDSISNLVRVKIVDSSNSLVSGVSPASPAAFKIVGSLTFSEPLAGTYLNVGQANTLIKWTKSGSFANVNIWYSTDGTNFNNEIIASTSAALLQYSWPSVPATPSNNVVIRVADGNDPETKALSGVLHIHRVYDITQPENGVILAVGTSYDIKWNTTGGTSANVKLQYATNGGGTAGNWVDILGAANLVNSNPGSFAWTVPNAISSQVKVRVVDLADTDNWNESGVQNNATAGIFKIQPDLRIVSPNGNANASLTDKLLVGSTVPIQWYVNGTMSTVKLQLSVNGGAYADITGATAINAASGQTGCTPAPCWNWTIPNNISQQVRVRVVNEADTTVFDSSDYDFAIRGSFTWSYPTTAGTVFKSGETKVLSWTTTGSMANVKLEYSTNNGSSYSAMLDTGGLPATNIVNSGSFNWPVPTNVVSKDVFLQITGTNDPNSTTTTQKIKIAGILSLSAPAGGARWGAATTQQIKWTTTGPTANIKIEYSLNGGTSWVTPAITDSVAGTGQAGCTPAPCFNWLVPTTTSPNVVIRLSDVITDS